MKKLFTILMVVVFSTTAAFSQGGTFAVGVGSEMSNADEEKSWQNYSLVPTLGYFINDNMLVGLGFSMEAGDASSKQTHIDPFFRYYLSGALYANAGLNLMMDGNDGAEGETTIHLGGGLSLMWNDKVAIEPGLGIVLGEEDKTTIGMTLGISLRLGMDE